MTSAAIALALSVLAAPLTAAAAGEVAPQHAIDQGIAIDFTAANARAGAPVEFDFRLRDTATGTPLRGVRPAAWASRRRAGAPAPDCKRKVVTYLGADLFNRAEVDLNTYFVLALNEDATISVVDPLFGFGGSRLLAQLPLRSPGADWALGPDQATLFVSLPDSDAIAVADTRRWQIVREIPTGPHPRRVLALGGHVVVADDAGVSVIDAKTLANVRVPLPAVHEIAAGDDGNSVFAATAQGVARIDLRRPQAPQRVALDFVPTLLAYSSAAKAVYALDAAQGRLSAFDARTLAARGTLIVEPGATQIRFAPDGRHALLLNPARNRVQVLDAASNRIVQNGDVDAAPERVSYSDLIAYVQRRDSESVLMITLDQLGAEGRALDAGDFPAGQHALGAAGVADAIVAAPDGPAVLVPNAADKMIYLYKEGMAAPAGGFSTGSHAPRAALVVDHGLRERARGDYATTVPLRDAGNYDVALFLDSPRVIACFSLAVAGDAPTAGPKTRVVALDPPAHLVHGAAAHLAFALTDAAQGAPRRADDVRALVFEAPGVWQHHVDAQVDAQGHYAIDFVPPAAGTYYVWIESDALGLDRRSTQFSVFEAD